MTPIQHAISFMNIPFLNDQDVFYCIGMKSNPLYIQAILPIIYN